MQLILEILFLIGNPNKISKEKSLCKGKSSLVCYISSTEGRRKLKFSKVVL